MKAYTDYPFTQDSCVEVKEIDVLSYDRNKYAVVEYQGEEYTIKRGYIWRDVALTTGFPVIYWCSLPQ